MEDTSVGGGGEEIDIHEEEDDGHPVVVGELLALTVLPVHGDLVVQGDVEGVLHPAVGPRVGREGVCEVGGAPALDGTSHVLTAGDEHREQGQQHLEEGKGREGKEGVNVQDYHLRGAR